MRMDASRNGGEIAFRTAFSDGYDLVQVMCGLSSIPEKNSPVDFRLAALQRKGHPDIWHMDQVLAFSTDECSPMVINGEDIGGNHGHPCAIRVHAPGHGKDVRDVGSLWADEGGMRFTLLRIDSADTLLFLSENIGPSVTEYAFADHMDGTLACIENALHTGEIIPQNQQGGVQLTPAIRHLQRDVVCLKDGRWQEIGGWVEGCKRAEIREVYEIINPATVAQAIRDGRPEDGYTVQPSLAAGEAMFLHRMTYRIEPDGTILCDFDHRVLQDVRMSCYLGIMHQEKCDLYGGGLWRYIPKVKPFTAKGYQLDFSRPYRTTADTLPNNVPLSPDTWANPASPPDRQIDIIRRCDGSDAVAFASGFLPVYDGVPEKRRGSITDACTLVKSCKTYPTFAGGMCDSRNFATLRGIAYKKYFLPEAGGCVYTVPGEDCTWVYMDLFTPGCMRYTISPLETAEMVEASTAWSVLDGFITAAGEPGYAVFRVTGPDKKG